jgi:hypothetical protein
MIVPLNGAGHQARLCASAFGGEGNDFNMITRGIEQTRGPDSYTVMAALAIAMQWDWQCLPGTIRKRRIGKPHRRAVDIVYGVGLSNARVPTECQMHILLRRLYADLPF